MSSMNDSEVAGRMMKKIGNSDTNHNRFLLAAEL